MAITQEKRLIAIDTPLGKDVLLLQGFTGQEGISRPFVFHLDLLSEDPKIGFDKIVGQKVTIRITLADGSERYFHGYVSRFSQSGSDQRFTAYRAEVVPWLWFLTRTSDCRIFQNMTIPDIILKIFKDLGFSDVKNSLQGSFEPRDYCVQYRETDFNFVSRLMEQYGIFYFFEHEKDKHTLVLGNSPSVHQPCKGQAKARYDTVAGVTDEEDIVTSWQMEQELRPGKYALSDYNFETPSTSLAVNAASTVTVGGNGKYEIYDYPGEYLKKAQGDSLVKIRMEEEETPNLVLSGASGCRAFTSGYRFDLAEHHRQDMNTAYVLAQVQHAASVGDSYTSGGSGATETYSNQFVCIPHAVPYRPPRVTLKPVVQGPQTAVVVGKAGEEIWVDKHSRVKVQFHWDREGKRDENSSCWVRVSQPWAGKTWGAIAIPRIGQEVIVDFLEGDPDQPIITGRVYNAEQMPPYALPANQTQTGIKSRSSKGGGDANFNEIRFEDKKGSEQLYIHAEKDKQVIVENDRTESVGHDEKISIGNNRTEDVGKNETISIGENRTEDVGKNETISIGENRTEDVGKNETISIGENRKETVGKNEEMSIGDNRTTNIGKDEQLSVGKRLLVQAGDLIVLKTGSASITMKQSGEITIKGSDITISGSGKINIKASSDVIIKGSNVKSN